MTAQMGLSEEVIDERFDRLLDALEAKDFEKVRQLAGGIPLPPKLAMQRRSYMSKEEILDLGYDMSLVEAEYGKDWYNAPRTVAKSAASGI